MLPYLRSSGFYGVSRVDFFALDWHLITAFVERWRPETHTFHMQCGECAITLQDVQIQLGLPIEGMPVTGDTDRDYTELCEELLGVRPTPRDLYGNKLKARWLRTNVPTVTDASDEVAVQRYVRSYILQLIGGSLFADKSNSLVHLMYLPLLTNLQTAGQYSWGSACLAYLYRELCRASQTGAHEIAGPVELLQLWAWDRFPFLAPRRLGHPAYQPRTSDGVPFPNDVPLGTRWVDLKSVTEVSTHVLKAYRERLDIQNEDDVVWQPYLDVIESLPLYCTNGQASWMSLCPLICFHIVEWHRPDRVMRQFGMTQVVPAHCEFDSELHRVDLRGHPQTNWAQEHANYIQQWENRGENIADGDQGINDDQNEEYMRWYRSVTRRFIAHHGALRGYAVDLVHRVRRILIDDGLEQGIAACDEGLRIFTEDQRRWTSMWNDGNFAQPNIPNENTQQQEENEDEAEEEEEEAHQRQSNTRRRRRTRRTETLGESSRRPSQPLPSRAPSIRSAQLPPTPVYNPGSPPPYHGAHMFASRPMGMHVPPYPIIDPFAPGPSSSYVDYSIPRHPMHVSQHMPTPFTPYYNYNVPYGGDGSFMPMHVPPKPTHFPAAAQHYSASRYVGMVQQPEFDDVNDSEEEQGPEQDQEQEEAAMQLRGNRRASQAPQIQQNAPPPRQSTRTSRRPVCHTELIRKQRHHR